MNRSRKGVIPVILIVVLALVIAVGGVGIGLAWKTNVLDKWLPVNVKEFFGKEITPTNGEQTNGEQPNGEEESTNGEEPTPEDPTKDWKSYTSERLGFSAKYPKDWQVVDDPDGVDRGFNFSSLDIAYDLVLSPIKGITIGISIVSNSNALTAREWLTTESGFSPVVKEDLLVGGNSTALGEWDGEWLGMAVGAVVEVDNEIYSFVCYYPRGAGVSEKNRCTEVLKLMLGTVEFLE